MPVHSGWKNGFMKVWLNCDMGEGMGNEEEIMPCIQAANIACGYHAGHADSIRETMMRCLRYGVSVGAHPSYNDREHFGRREMDLPVQVLYECITRQLELFYQVAYSLDVTPTHVKPHGALYNQSARDPVIAAVVANAVKDFDSTLTVYGLSGSISLIRAEALGLVTAHETFADRSYQDDASLTPRSLPGALLNDPETVVKQVFQMAGTGTVTTVSGKIIPLRADTICIHGDGEHAVTFARAIREALTKIDE